MTRNKMTEKEQNPLPKSTKPTGLVNLRRMIFIVEIIRRGESQASVGFHAILGKSSTAIPQAAGPPFAAHAEIQCQVGGLEQSFQTTISLPSDPL